MGWLMASPGHSIKMGDTGKPMTPEELNSMRIVREGKALEVIQAKDRSAPTIDHRVVSGAKRGKALTVRADISDSSGVASVRLFYRSSDQEPYNVLEMEHIQGDVYRGIIPEYMVIDPGLEYYIAAVDSLGNGPALSGAALHPHRITFGSSQGSLTPQLSFVLLVGIVLAVAVLPRFFRKKDPLLH